MENKNIENLTTQLLKEIGENPSREGLLKTPSRVSKAWRFFAAGYNQDLDKIINNAKISNVDYLLTISVNLEDFDKVHEVTQNYENIFLG